MLTSWLGKESAYYAGFTKQTGDKSINIYTLYSIYTRIARKFVTGLGQQGIHLEFVLWQMTECI